MSEASNDQPQAENPSTRTYAGWLRKRAKVLALFSIVALVGVGLLGDWLPVIPCPRLKSYWTSRSWS